MEVPLHWISQSFQINPKFNVNNLLKIAWQSIYLLNADLHDRIKCLKCLPRFRYKSYGYPEKTHSVSSINRSIVLELNLRPDWCVKNTLVKTVCLFIRFEKWGWGGILEGISWGCTVPFLEKGNTFGIIIFLFNFNNDKNFPSLVCNQPIS